MNRIYYIIVGFSILWISCDKKENTINPNDSIIDLAYSSSYYYPNGFYHEIIDSGSIYYENTVSIAPTDKRKDIWIELNTTDIKQAREWSELSNQYSSVNRLIVKELANNKYFEFIRVSTTSSKDILLSRVHNSNYFIPLLDKFKAIDTVGKFKMTNFQKSDVKELIEYLWSAGVIGYSDKVLESNVIENTDNYEHLIKSISIVYGDFGLNDYIYLYDNRFLINKQNGLITMTKVQTDLIKGKHH